MAKYSQYPEKLDTLGAGGSLPDTPDKLSSFDPIAYVGETITPQARTIPFMGIDPSRIPQQGIVRIDNEILTYKSVQPNVGDSSGALLLTTSTERGLAGTVPAQHHVGTHILWLITSVHFTVAYEAIAAIQQKIGTTNSTDVLSHDYRIRKIEHSIASGDNAFLADTFTLTRDDIERCYVELRQPVKTRTDIVMFVKNGPSQHVGHDLYVSLNNDRIVEWRVGGDLASTLQQGDVVTVVYRAAP